METETPLKSSKTTSGREGATLCYWAAGLAFTSELIHLWVLPGEFVISPLRGLFFFLVAACQGMLAVGLLFGPGRWALRFGILLNVGLVAVWATTHFAAFWVFPPLLGFVLLPVEMLDLAATAVEIALIVLLVRLRRDLPPKKRRRHVRPGARPENRKEVRR